MRTRPRGYASSAVPAALPKVDRGPAPGARSRPWLDGDWPTVVTVTGVAASIEVTTGGISLEQVALVTGLPLVDLSMEWDDHIVRGTQ